MSDELSPAMQAQIDHLAGKQVVVEYVFADGRGRRFLLESLDEESDARALWGDVAFTNGPPLVEIKMRWEPALADELRAHFATESTESPPTRADDRLMRPSHATNEIHGTDPQPGDYWHEMLEAICIVVARRGDHVCVCRKKCDLGRDYQFIDPEWMTVQGFRSWLRYDRIDGYWADCEPGARVKDVASYEALIPALAECPRST